MKYLIHNIKIYVKLKRFINYNIVKTIKINYLILIYYFS